jgi:creatinine amidohydrolase
MTDTEHRMALLTRTELGDRAPDAIAVLPIGATEQHGPHLPVGTDHLVVDRIAHLAARVAQDSGVDVIVAPTVPFGLSAHHLAFGATVTVSATTLMAYLDQACRSLLDSGFRRLFLLNGHGGNDELIRVVARELGVSTGLPIAASSYWLVAWDRLLAAGIQDAGRLPGHAGAFETAVFGALFPEHVLQSPPRRPNATSPRARYYPDVHVEDVSIWQRIDGFSDDPSAATTELGARAVAEIVAALAEAWGAAIRHDKSADGHDKKETGSSGTAPLPF